jgi:hypothetical protein
MSAHQRRLRPPLSAAHDEADEATEENPVRGDLDVKVADAMNYASAMNAPLVQGDELNCFPLGHHKQYMLDHTRIPLFHLAHCGGIYNRE